MMSEEKHEALSALMDGELDSTPAARLLDNVIADPELKALWARHHLVSDALRGKLPDIAAGDLAARVRAGVDAEPARLITRRRLRVALKPVAGLALAASVAVVAILGVQALERDTRQAPLQVAERTERLPQMRWNVDRPAVEARLNGYLVNHSEYLGNGMRGIFPYARIVAYDDNK